MSDQQIGTRPPLRRTIEEQVWSTMRLSFVMHMSFDWRLLVSFLSRTVEDLQNIFGGSVPLLHYACAEQLPPRSLEAGKGIPAAEVRRRLPQAG